MKGMRKLRINKFISECGVCSRREAETLIRAGKVTVNGKPADIGMDIDPQRDRVVCSGKRIRIKSCDKRYFAFYKPRGVITSMKAQDDRSTVADLIQGINGRVYPVGRLDKDSEGLLILTDDGQAAQRMMHPGYQIKKTYRVTVEGSPSDEQLDRLRGGVGITDEEKGLDFITAPAEVTIHSSDDRKTVLYITIHEGKNRQIRRMCEAVGLRIMLLKRIAVADINIGSLAPGAYRPLSHSEVVKLLTELKIDPETRISKKAEARKPIVSNRNRLRRGRNISINEKRFLRQFASKSKGSKGA